MSGASCADMCSQAIRLVRSWQDDQAAAMLQEVDMLTQLVTGDDIDLPALLRMLAECLQAAALRDTRGDREVDRA